MQTAKWMRLKYAGLAIFCCLSSASASEVKTIPDNETLVMRIIFDDCLGFIQKDITPFQGLLLLPITVKGSDALRARYTENGAIHHLFSDRYVVAWGEDSDDRYCIVLTSRPSDQPMMLGVKRAGFLKRLTKRADAAGMTENNMPGPFSPLYTMSWRSPDEDGQSGLRMVVMPSGSSKDKQIADAGIIVVAQSISGQED
ncbi:hypothetical protein [Parasphingorhabdus cellanae]|uniref:Uncharacterized protein n=1 Tax=Parasphingorhabdus cellanae TaxID=2806553 RepID=A0ABX7T8B8_9SPHN|nr:hypothetical protein [Parasphingorhabdus cellanae]QTD56382.1 hypothetical protein J4G78_01910 [Parasphingorhabdus cellanae]